MYLINLYKIEKGRYQPHFIGATAEYMRNKAFSLKSLEMSGVEVGHSSCWPRAFSFPHQSALPQGWGGN